MSASETLPAHEAIPEGLVDHLRQQARIDRAREMGAFLAAVFRGLVPRRPPPAGSGLAST